MRKGFSRVFTFTAVSAVLFVTACFGGKPTDSYVNVNTTKISTGLVPANSNELSAHRILSMLFSGLVYIDKDARIQNEVAKSIETADNRVWTITLREDFKFSNGEKVTAKSFVDAWNFAAKISNAMGNRDFLGNIEGFTEKGDTDLSGLKILDEYKFRVILKSPNRNFVAKLSYSVFWPLPSDAYKDIRAFGLKPIGNGPYSLVSFTQDVEAVLKKNPDYKGPRQPRNSGLRYKIYSDPGPAYADVLSDSSDVTDIIPPNAQEKFQSDFSSRWVRREIAATIYIAIPGYVAHFAFDREGILRRKAVSMAINRQDIADKIYHGARVPARDFTSPSVLGYKAGLPGSDVLKYDPERAKQLWAQADAISPWGSGVLYLNFAATRGDKALFEALANSIKNVLGIEVQAYPNTDWKANLLHGQQTKQPFRIGWAADWPAIDTYLGSLFHSQASNNYYEFRNAEYDSLLVKAAEALTFPKAQDYYDKLQEILFQNMPVVPLFYDRGGLVWSKNVSNVESNWVGVPVYYLITKG
ncbi:peptide ABC transporter substrate-binding protein [Tropheryma whipplei]|uniref:peptide ABC transporter substrate-binding protein n=1 Tax=Tropheryma whipplei TaxID=2039 RepID=UPI0005AA5E5B|nr:ABC transporter substrate-binding protein [Tropheryma whipplei]